MKQARKEKENAGDKSGVKGTEGRTVDVKYLEVPCGEFERPRDNYAVIKVGNTEYHYVFKYAKSKEPTMALQIRTFYSLHQKQQVWNLLRTQSLNRVFELCGQRIPLGTLESWKKQMKRGEPITKKRTGRKPLCPELESKLFDWFKQRRAQLLPVRRKDLQETAMKLAQELKIEDKFKASMNWVENFEKRHSLSLRQRTRVASRSAREMKEIVQKFYQTLNEKLEHMKYADIWNYDEVGIYFEPHIPRTVEAKGARSVSILSVKASYMKMTVILLISASGLLGPPVLLYYNKGFEPFVLQTNPDILIASNPRGYNLEETNYNVVLPHFLKYIKEGSLLLLDECHAHRSQRIDKLLESKQVSCLRIPGGTTCLLQPVDCNIGKIVKTEVKNCFIKWYLSSFEEITKPEGRRKKSFKRPSNQQMTAWILEGLKKIRKDDIISSFTNTGIICKKMQEVTLREKVSRFFVHIEHNPSHFDPAPSLPPSQKPQPDITLSQPQTIGSKDDDFLQTCEATTS